ncbi:hypothetical protein ISN44_As11g031460 [Arabidopsis suecica]|uniref:Uncharacterized protein n=1 Tax=Arabidopsis suecica TaxID=45249 RepID=A0A8T1ZG67_ARASU|nr:hypothetical protein ISN44_As11g031460 [Arabidopsis suecica]
MFRGLETADMARVAAHIAPASVTSSNFLHSFSFLVSVPFGCGSVVVFDVVEPWVSRSVRLFSPVSLGDIGGSGFFSRRLLSLPSSANLCIIGSPLCYLGLSGSRLSYGSSGRPLTKTLIEKDASYAEKAKFHSLVFAICVEARSHILLCGKSLCTKDVEHEPELERELVAEERAEGAKLRAEGAKLIAEEELVAEEALIAPTGPMTRSRVKLFNQAIGGMLNHIWDRPNDLSQVTTSLVLIHAQRPHQDG